MTAQPPTLAPPPQQIEAVEQAMDILAHMMATELDDLLRRLSAAVEQLKTWEFAQEALN